MNPNELNLQQELHDLQPPMTPTQLKKAAKKAAAAMKSLPLAGSAEQPSKPLDSTAATQEPYRATQTWTQLAAENPESVGLRTLAKWEQEGSMPSSIGAPRTSSTRQPRLHPDDIKTVSRASWTAEPRTTIPRPKPRNIVEAVMQAHPNLSREEAEQALIDFGA